ncbi:MAG: S16 family serine protease [bacterium]
MSPTTILRCKTRLPMVATDRKGKYPILALQTAILFPGNVLTIRVRRQDSQRLTKDCGDGKRRLIATYSPVESEQAEVRRICQVGVIATIRDSREAEAGERLVTLEGLGRAAIDTVVATEPYIVATAIEIQPPGPAPNSVKGQLESVISMVAEITRLDPTYSLELLNVLKMYRENPSHLADQVAATFHFPLDAKQALLEAVGLRQRYAKILELLSDELHRLIDVPVLDDDSSAANKPTGSASAGPILASRRMSVADEPARIQRLVRNARHLPPEVVARATLEADRLGQLPSASAEYGATKLYLDRILNLPWGRYSPDTYDIDQAERIIDSEYYGTKNVKEQILQRLAVRKLQGGHYDGPTLCLVGAPGTGKASLAKAIARALGKEFLRISVGGISEVDDLKGSPRTFVGAMPGKIIRALRGAGSSDPVVLIEDIDYFNIDNDSGVNAALLEALDTRYNTTFLDEYLGVPFDLSRVLFVCSVRSHEEIPEQFIPRFELLEIPGYIEKEKIAIAKRFIIPNMLKRHGILKSEFKINDRALLTILAGYTMEAGLLGFSQQIEKVCRKVALEKTQQKKTSWTITEKSVGYYLGPTIFIPEKAENLPEIGIAAGLAWTGAGGDLMFIEGLKMKGDGQIMTTGSLGEVMRESIQAAHSYVRTKADVLGIDNNDFKEFDIHIHFPSGAIPKDGPSAGVTVCLVIASVLAERPIRNDLAMTGELTLRGKVLPVGGIKEKVSAAYRTGIYHVAIPKANEKDIKDLPKEILRKVKFSFLERVDELFELCLMDFTPSAFTLEKVFADEIAKAKKKAEKSRASKPKPRVKPKAARSPKKK